MTSRPEFGVSSSRFSSKGQQKGHRLGSTHANNTSLKQYGLPSQSTDAPTNIDQRFEDIQALDDLESKFGFDRYEGGPERLGWLINMHTTLIMDDNWSGGYAGVNYYFIAENGQTFKTTLRYSPYFYIGCKNGTETEVEDYLRRRFEDTIEKMTRLEKDDLKMQNHLIGNTRMLIKLSFRNVSDLLSVRKVLLPIAKKNQRKLEAVDTYADVVNETNNVSYEPEYSSAMSSRKNPQEALDNIIDIREFDIPYYVRVAIDLDIRVGLWYTAKVYSDGSATLKRREDLVHRPDPVVFAFDIETTKLPLKFPDATIDSIMMISYMIEGRGYLITNREIVSQDIEDFEYTPKPEFEGPFTIFNEADEPAVLRRFFEHIQEAKPTIFVTYNGDFFDWPFVEARAKVHGMDMYQEIGVYKDEEDEYKCKHASHMDAFRWVKRDSYLPQGSQGLKAVTTAKLGYNPMELDPEDMTRFASEHPQTLAQYSVSDAVATFYLYMKYVHPFIFSLCNIIPLVPDEVLRKGSGTLCELLLMVEAYKVNVIMPNKHVEETDQFYEGHKVENQTYVGGHVEALEAGVFRSDIATDFKMDPSAAQQLIDQLDDALKFTIQVEEKKKLTDVANYDEVYNEIKQQLEQLRDSPIRKEPPLIYHLDVAAMYPNIILTNRLQPDAMIDESMCATCEFNVPGKQCDRRMTWTWRGEYSPAKRNEYRMIEHQLSIETFPPKIPNGAPRTWHSLTDTERQSLINKRLNEYAKKVYKKVRETKTEERESIICQRENPFYIETVRAFRDRRYEYKGLHKVWKQNLDKANAEGSITKVAEAKNMIVLYDSLQLAHKCILNSFYGYVMRKGARWHSLEMAGIVCLTGSKIIQMARQLVERIGRPLELDTDGIWCILPESFPETFTFTLHNGKKFRIDYPCTMLNHLVHAQFTNHQYQTLVNSETMEYKTHSENSIFFEIDGPYRAMILPSSTMEDKLLKKRYAVFNKDGSLAELKGFEVKRRGELKLIKIFQSDLFKVFLDGNSLEECYQAVAKVANQWLDILYSKGIELQDDELFELISENRSMSKTLDEYGSQKSTSISTAKRLAEFLGDQMVKDKGLACKFVISARPYDLPVSERAIPVAIFSAELSVKKHYLRKWLKDDSLMTFDIRDILDWQYYLERFGSVIQKLITIPAAMQKVRNPVPRVAHPDWLFKRISAKDDKMKQHRITDMFTTRLPSMEDENDPMDIIDGDDDVEMGDIEELNIGSGSIVNNHFLPKTAKVTKRKHSGQRGDNNDKMDIDSDPNNLAEEDLPENMPDMFEDYQGWLAYQKRKWKRQRQNREIRRQQLSDRPSTTDGNLSSLFRRQTGSLLMCPWQIIQIAETDTPGDFKMWVLIQQQLRSIRLSVPRVFYVNSYEEAPQTIINQNPSCIIDKCVRTLPRSHRCLNLFQMTMSETIFQDELKKFSTIFNHPSTEGVYETQVPLSIRAMLQLGSVCQVDKLKIDAHTRLEDVFSLDSLKPRLDLTSGYFEHPERFHFVYFYHVTSERRHFFALVGASLLQSHVFLVGVDARSRQMPNVNKLYLDKYQQIMPNNSSRAVQVKDSMDFETTYHATERDAFKAINRVLTQIDDIKQGPTILAINSPRQASYLTQKVPAINFFPYVTVPSLQQNNQFDALNWLNPVCKQMLAHYMHLGPWLDERFDQARYVNVPFCNIPNDPYLFMADILFAKQLMNNDMVLWWSSAPKPDLGGRENDENISVANDLVSNEMNHPGAYETVCVEMDVLRLCLNTVIMAPVINEVEGTVATIGFDQTMHTMDEYTKGAVKYISTFGDATISSKTFGVLRTTVQQWFQEAMVDNNTMSVMLQDTLLRWLLSPSSNMYDPCLHGLVHSMMKKVFMQLVAEFRRLGAKIVFANFRRIIIATAKESMEGAIAYWQYLSRSIQRKQVLEVMELKLVNYWQVLVWMDEMNYGGFLADGTQQTLETISQQTHTVTMKWNICDYLASAIQDQFKINVAQFIQQLYIIKQRYPRDIKHHIMQQKQQQDEDLPDPRAEKKRLYIRQTLTREVLQWLPKLIKRQEQALGQDDNPDMVFPQLAGSHLTLTNPALEFVKSLTVVLSLDHQLEDDVRLLKRNALEVVGSISEFSNEAQFQNPCEFLKLNEVVCTYCGYTEDLDICRDHHLFGQQQQMGKKSSVWRCRGCKVVYDKGLIEDSMIAQVNRWMMMYQLQDLMCQRCHWVKRENLLRQCDKCGSDFVVVQNKQDLIRKLKVFNNVAKDQQLTLLLNIIQWTLDRV
ncbi:uncharacterized protein BX664DRAFT_278331 [Halteromyces radiatus]|uniref:uncharacterized protein n=1 Tax=Halteromyces radiatus TaxID=101107 RepID=UPI0022207B77|nr:uncharacterized protein BX664DRAFT_278331 [Halteromyces radiatus]KAI8093391.1 hypothetical protein BX664DRAFT_278331 [Halteromyces radiatus]